MKSITVWIGALGILASSCGGGGGSSQQTASEITVPVSDTDAVTAPVDVTITEVPQDARLTQCGFNYWIADQASGDFITINRLNSSEYPPDDYHHSGVIKHPNKCSDEIAIQAKTPNAECGDYTATLFFDFTYEYPDSSTVQVCCERKDVSIRVKGCE